MVLNYLLTVLISMVPLIELRGAIPISVGLGVPEPLALLLAVLGNIVPIPLVFFYSRRFLEWGRDKKIIGNFCEWCYTKGEKGGKKLLAKTKDNIYIALFLFVGIPIPGTGAWTGTLAASILDLDLKKSIIAVVSGIIMAGLIMLAISFGLFELLF